MAEQFSKWAQIFKVKNGASALIKTGAIAYLTQGVSKGGSGVATGVARGAEYHPWQPKFAKNREMEGKNQEKEGEKSGKIGKKRQKSGSFFHFATPDR